MNNFLSRFYFLSKFVTSLILLIFLVLLSYLFVKTYLDQKNSNISNINIIELSDQISILARTVEQNSNNLNTIKSFVQDNKQSVKDISTSLKNFNDNKINNNILLKVEKLSEENKKLQNELYNISNDLEYFKYSNLEIKKTSKPLNNIVKLIRLKLDQGLNFSEEVEILQDLELDAENLSNVEKLSIYSTENFLGLESLNTNFNQIVSNYLNDYYLKRNNKYFLKYFFNLVSIQPHLNENVKDETVLLLSLAKQNLLNKNFNEAIKQLNLLNNGKYFFSTWIKDATYYNKVTILLNKF